MPDGQGYYGWSKPHNAHIRVMTFGKMLRDAELRNQLFFDQLKLGSPSLAAKRRAARSRIEGKYARRLRLRGSDMKTRTPVVIS
jgi:hypothetical protein